MDTQLHPVSAEVKDENTTITNYQKFEEIYIKEEPLKEISEDSEFYESELHSVKKEECISDNDEKSDKEYENPITGNNDIQNTDCKCQICNKCFGHKGALQNHLKTHNEANTDGFRCILCTNKSFVRKKDLRRHMLIHKGIKKFNCSLCKKSFTQSGDLSRHMVTHTGLKDFQCKICNKQFTLSNNLSRHMNVHKGIKVKKYDLQCEICSKLFAQKQVLSEHMKIHTGIAEYQCSICEKSFIRKDHLKRHMNTHNR